jgi:GlpG protein
MIELGSLNNPRAAQGFIDYLKSQGFNAQLTPQDARNVIISVAPEHFHQVKPLWVEFTQNPNHERYQKASWQVGNTQTSLHYQGQPLNLVARFKALSWLNQTVSVLSMGIYIAFLLGGFNTLFNLLEFNPAKPFTWFTPVLMHFSLMHIAFNLVWWMSLGDNIEKQCGKISLIGLFLVSALISNWGQYLISGPNFGGLSGVVYGLLGFCWVFSYLNPKKPALVSNAVIGFMLLWLAFGFADLLFFSMANWAHLIGLISGMAFAVTATLLTSKKAD